MNKEELQGKHLDAVISTTRHGLLPISTAAACTTITLQTVVDVLEKRLLSIKEEYEQIELMSKCEFNAGYLSALKAQINSMQNELTEYINLLNQK